MKKATPRHIRIRLLKDMVYTNEDKEEGRFLVGMSAHGKTGEKQHF